MLNFGITRGENAIETGKKLKYSTYILSINIQMKKIFDTWEGTNLKMLVKFPNHSARKPCSR